MPHATARNRILRQAGITILSLITLLMLVFIVLAPVYAAGNYAIIWWTVDGGGGESRSIGGSYTLVGTAGQPDTGALLTGNPYTLAGGFWGSAVSQYCLYLPLALRAY